MARGALLAAALLAIAGLPTSLWFEQQNPPVAMPWSVLGLGFTFSGFVGLAIRFSAPGIIRIARRLAELLPASFAAAFVTGLVLRIVVPFALQAVPSSDGATYLQLADQLVATHRYGVAGTLAFWPPGLPFLLAPMIAIGGDGFGMLIAYGLISFTIGAIGCWRLAIEGGLGRHAAAPVWLLAIWPTFVLCTGLPEKELFVAGLMPWIVLFAVRAARGSTVSAAIGGLLVGAAVLMQPAFQLLVVVPFLCTPWIAGRKVRHLANAVVLLVATLIVLSPWIARNHAVLGATVIATNGGGNLYRVNNELATGGFLPDGRVNLDDLGEVESDRVSKRLAVEWILQNPLRFVQLTAGKILLFAGDDSYGAYRALRVGQPMNDAALSSTWYELAKLGSEVPWMLMWLVVAAVACCTDRRFANSAGIAFGMFVPYLYLSGIHAFFESGGKYHLPALTCLFVGATWLLLRADAPDSISPFQLRESAFSA